MKIKVSKNELGYGLDIETKNWWVFLYTWKPFFTLQSKIDGKVKFLFKG